MKKLLLGLIASIFMVTLLSVNVFAFTGEGNGTLDNPYLITSPSQLKEINDSLGANYALGNDIDMADVSFTPIKAIFTGTFDGRGYKISNLSILYGSEVVSYVGLFSDVKDAYIHNLILDNVNITTKGNYVSAIAGRALGNSLFENCYINGTIKGNSNVGGIIGHNGSGNASINQCYVSGSVASSSTGVAGGFVGTFYGSGSISDSYSDADISGSSLGGLVGAFSGTTKIERSYASGNIISRNIEAYSGGLATTINGATNSIKNSMAANEQVKAGRVPGRIAGMSKNNTYSLENNIAYDNMLLLKGDVQQQVSPSSEHFSIHGEGKTLSELKQQSTYEALGWDFENVWAINEGEDFPYLRCFSALVNPIPNAPVLSEVSAGEEEISLEWTRVNNAEGYELSVNGDITYTTDTKITVGLEPGTEYEFKVRAIMDSSETTNWSNIITLVTEEAPDLEIIAFSYVASTEETVTLKWTEPKDAEIYEIEYDDETLTADTNEIVVENLEPGQEYTFKVRALSEGKSGEWSQEITTLTKALPPVPDNIMEYSSVSVSSDSVTKNYEASLVADGDMESRWLSEVGARECYIEIDFGEVVDFNQVRVYEFGERILDYTLEVWDESDWVEVYSGYRMGAECTIDFDRSTADKLRINILTVEGTRPSIYEIEVFNR